MNFPLRRRLGGAATQAALCFQLVAATVAHPLPIGEVRVHQEEGKASEVVPERVPEDTWNRGTPRGAVLGYLRASREGHWTDAARYLDLSRMSAPEAEASGPSLARQLKILLDQRLWIDLDDISEEPSGDLEDGLPPRRERVGTIVHGKGRTEVLLERVAREGDGILIWKFAQGTVARVPSLYEATGPGEILDRLPLVLLDTHFLEVALWQWIGLIVLALLAWISGWILCRVLLRLLRLWAARTSSNVDDRILALADAPLRLLVTIGLFNAALHVLHLSLPANRFLGDTSQVLVVATVAWLALRGIDLGSRLVKQRLADRGRAGASNLVPLGARAIKIAILAITLLATLDTFGFDVTAILAGLGVGGLAIALAAQKTVENVFGGITILVDQPVRPGDFCRFGDRMGTVEDIGIRSTRIRTLDRTLVSVPNAEFSALQIENFAARDRIRLITTIGLRYETTPDQLRHVIAGLRRVLRSHPRIGPEPQRVRLIAFGSSSLDLEVFAYVATTDFDEYLGVREDIYLRFMDVVAASGTGFAFPSTTTYLARDGGIDPARREAAEVAVSNWRAEGRLMFPEYADEEIRSMAGTLDWPPRGSAMHGRTGTTR